MKAFARAGAPLAVAALVAAAIVGVRTSRDDPAPAPRAIGPEATLHAEIARAEWNRLVEEKIEEAAAGSTCHSSVRGDFDGDGAADTALVYGRPGECLEPDGASRLRLILGDGRRLERSLRSEGLRWDDPKRPHACAISCAAFAATDIDGNGREELAIELDHGASQSFFGLFRLDGRSLVRIPLIEKGKLIPMTFGYHGSLCCASDTLCRTREGRSYVIDVSVGHSDFYTVAEEEEYRYDGRVLRRTRTRMHHWPWRGATHLVPGRRCFDEGPRRDGWPQLRQSYLGF
jgi:hypothetical protein